MQDPWGDYSKGAEEEFLGPDRGDITSQLYISDEELGAINDVLGTEVDEAFDVFEEKEFASSEYQTEAAVLSNGGNIRLEGSRDMPPETLVHESVHGLMMEDDGSYDLPGENHFQHRLYDEFVARMAEDEISEIDVPRRTLNDLREAHDDYMATREKYSGGILTEEFQSLYDDALQTDHTTDHEAQRDIDARMQEYRGLREQVLAAEAAKRYKQETGDVDVREFIKPDENLYHSSIEYIQQVEDEVVGAR